MQKTKAAVFFIPAEVVEKALHGKGHQYLWDHGDRVGQELTPYVLQHFPRIERGDALELGMLFGCEDRKEHFMFWDGARVIPQCGDFYTYDGGGAPLCFKTFTEFPPNYFSEVAWFGHSIYLDYDTFVDQVRKWTATRCSPAALQEPEPEQDDSSAELLLEYNGTLHSLPLDEADAFDSLAEYVETIQQGRAQWIMLVNAHNQIVDIEGDAVYEADDGGSESDC